MQRMQWDTAIHANERGELKTQNISLWNGEEKSHESLEPFLEKFPNNFFLPMYAIDCTYTDIVVVWIA